MTIFFERSYIPYRQTKSYEMDWVGYIVSPLYTIYNTSIGNLNRLFENIAVTNKNKEIYSQNKKIEKLNRYSIEHGIRKIFHVERKIDKNPTLTLQKEITIIKTIALGIFIYLIAMPLSSLAFTWSAKILIKHGFNLTQQQHIINVIKDVKQLPFPINQCWQMYLFGNVCIFSPVFEEHVYRDLIHKWIFEHQPNPDHILSKIWRVSVSGVVFGMAHSIPSQSWLNIPLVFSLSVVGIIQAIVREQQGNTYATTTCHIIHNSIGWIRNM